MSFASWLLDRPYWEYSLTVAVVSEIVYAVGRIGGRANTRVVAFAGDLAMIALIRLEERPLRGPATDVPLGPSAPRPAPAE